MNHVRVHLCVNISFPEKYVGVKVLVWMCICKHVCVNVYVCVREDVNVCACAHVDVNMRGLIPQQHTHGDS